MAQHDQDRDVGVVTKKRLARAIERPKDTSQTFERVVIDNLAAFTPWLAPLIPAFLTYTLMVGSLSYPTWVAFIGALVVECLGLTAIYTATQFWDYNDAKATEKENRLVSMDAKARKLAKQKKQRNAPFRWAAGAMGFYIVVILTVNAALEMEVTQAGFTVKVFSNALLSLLSVVAGLIIALRSQHRRRVEKSSRRKKANVTTQPPAQNAANFASSEEAIRTQPGAGAGRGAAAERAPTRVPPPRFVSILPSRFRTWSA